MEKTYSLAEFGYKAVFGKFAQQADNAVWVQQGGTVVLAVVVSEASQEFPGFFPLTVEYREQFAAAGRIPGGYLKREGKPSDHEVLSARLVDRALRPLFPENYFDKVVISITAYSIDKNHNPQTLALLAASLALAGSKIPFMRPVGIAEVVRVQGEWIYSPTFEKMQAADTRIAVAGDMQGINMVEGSLQEVSEKELIEVLQQAHLVIKKQIQWQETIIKDLGIEKSPINDLFDWALWEERARAILTEERVRSLFVKDRIESKKRQKEVQELFLTTYKAEAEELKISPTFLSYVFDKEFKSAINKAIFTLNHRIDTRDFETVRPISVEVGLLPCNHGSALFKRGNTQALASLTLGGGQDQLRVDTVMGEETRPFMLNYNFPSFAVGEARPNRGVSRREIGHGYLAYSAIEQVLPDHETFPYTIRIVSDVLESDGSSSMATVCVSTMSLMDAGVPIKKMVSGVAMGLLYDEESDEYRILTDIAGIEDSFGLMDFKVAGTDHGIVALQMDVKLKGGLKWSVLEQALAQALRGRTFILHEMQKVMSKPKSSLSDMVPKIVSFHIPREKIGAVIGSGGKIIKEIIEKTATTIDIEDDGLVKIFGHPGAGLDKSVHWVKTLAGLIEIGTQYSGTIKRIADFGIFVELVPGVDGLVHVSTVPRAEQQQFMRKYKENDQVKVEVIDYDKSTDRIRLKIVDEK